MIRILFGGQGEQLLEHLIKRVVRVSMETMKIVKSLPALNEQK